IPERAHLHIVNRFYVLPSERGQWIEIGSHRAVFGQVIYLPSLPVPASLLTFGGLIRRGRVVAVLISAGRRHRLSFSKARFRFWVEVCVFARQLLRLPNIIFEIVLLLG